MRILHTSDWHLGKTIAGNSRLSEQEALLTEILHIAQRQNVDLVLVAGDVYNTYNPTADAERLFYGLMEDLSRLNIPCVVIAGNHDSPERLGAPTKILASKGIHVLTLPGDVPFGKDVVEAAPNFLRLHTKSGDCDIAALAYPSLGRLDCNEEEYREKIADIFAQAQKHFAKGNVHIAMTHLFAVGGEVTSGERQIDGIGGALRVDAEALGEVQYKALGHLHKRQNARGAQYSGSIMQQDFDEADSLKYCLLVDVEPDGEAAITEVPLTSGRYLAKWKVGSLTEAQALIASGKDANAWIDITIETDATYTQREIAELQRMRERIVNITVSPLTKVSADIEASENPTLPANELFRKFYMEECKTEPSNELVKLFLSMLSEGGNEK